jgi:hypothetical protein
MKGDGVMVEIIPAVIYYTGRLVKVREETRHGSIITEIIWFSG